VLTSTDSVPLSSGLKVVATTHALSTEPMNSVAILEAVLLLVFPDSSRIGAPMLTVIPKMIKRAPSHVTVELTIRLSFALEPNCHNYSSTTYMYALKINKIIK